MQSENGPSIHVRLLGERDLIGADGSRTEGLFSQPKRFALFAYLAIGLPSRAHSRDDLVALFWPDAAAAKARNALSQAISVIRRTVGPEAIVATVHEIAVDPRVVVCDVWQFMDAIARGCDGAALALYRGDLLAGFRLERAPEFQDWLETERAQLRQRAVGCARRLVERAIAAGEPHRALAYAERGSQLDPFDEMMVRHAMAAHEAIGNPAGAVRAYQEYVGRLSAGLDLEPSLQLHAYHDEIRARARASVAPEVAHRLTPTSLGASTEQLAEDVATRTAPRRRTRPRLLTGAALVLLGAGGLVLVSGQTRLAPPPASRLTVMLDDTVRLRSELGGVTVALSRDGSRIAYVGGTTPRIYVRAIDELTPHAVPGTEGARLPQFSPDGQWLAYIRDNRLERVRPSGGPPIVIADSANRFSWGDGDVIVFDRPFGSQLGESLYEVGLAGGAPRRLTQIDTTLGEAIHTWPSLLPGGHSALFEIREKNSDAAELAAVRLGDGRTIRLGLRGHNPRFIAPGFVVFGSDDRGIYAAPFDAARLVVTGPAVRVLDGVVVKQGGATEFTISESGTLLYVSPSQSRRLMLLDRSGRGAPLRFRSDAYSGPRLSPDGKRLAVAIAHAGGSDVWTADLASDTLVRVTHDGVSDSPEWAPDGRLLWRRMVGAVPEIWWQRSTSAQRLVGEEATITVSPSLSFAIAASTWSDGRAHRNAMLRQFSFDSSGRATGATTLMMGALPRVSPDGEWVAFVGGGQGRREIFVRRLVAPFDTRRVSVGVADDPVWGATSRELVYRASGQFVVATFASTRDGSVSRRDTLFADEFWRREVEDAADYDVSRDGKQFVLVKSVGPAGQPTVVFNWTSDVLRRLATAKSRQR